MNPISSFLIPIAVMGVLSLLLWAARRSQATTDPATGALLFRHTALFRWFSIFAAFGIPVAITVLVFFNPPKKEGDVWAIFFLYALFAGLGGPLFWETMRFVVTVSPEGLDCRSPWRRGRFLRWDEIREVSYSAINSWFILHAADGWKFRVSVLIAGVSQFLEECERHLPAEAFAGARIGYERVGRRLPEPVERRGPMS